MILRVVVALLALALTGCDVVMYLSPAIESWEAEVMGIPVVYKLVRGNDVYGGVMTWTGGVCRIALDVRLEGDEQVMVAAHEIGHCIDGAHLGWSSNGWGNAGCFHFGKHYCDPKEGFAQAWAHAYVLACGHARSPLGLRPGDGVECGLPDPRSIDPRRWYW